MGWSAMTRHGVAIALLSLLAAKAVAAQEVPQLAGVTARAAILVDAHTGEVYFARNPTLPLPPASTTKLVTALIAMHRLTPDAVLPVSFYASTMPASKAYLRPGWQMRARDLLYALMLRSANDAAVVIAEAIGGSVPGFAQLMNAKARSLGATQTNFVTPNGLPSDNHYTTAHDMALVMREVLNTPGMRQILSTRTAVIEPFAGGRRRIAFRSTNRLLWRDDLHVIGKTGWTRQAKRCFVGAGSANGREVIVAVLGSSNLWGDVESLVTYGLAQGSPDDWQQRNGWQQAAASSAPVDSGWSLPVNDADELAEVAPAPRAADERRAMRMAALAPTAKNARGRTVKRSAQAQGDGMDGRRAGMRYSLQFGAYRSKARADQLRKDLSLRGYQAAVEPASGGYRVKVSNFASHDAARLAARRLGRVLRVDPVIVATK